MKDENITGGEGNLSQDSEVERLDRYDEKGFVLEDKFDNAKTIEDTPGRNDPPFDTLNPKQNMGKSEHSTGMGSSLNGAPTRLDPASKKMKPKIVSYQGRARRENDHIKIDESDIHPKRKRDTNKEPESSGLAMPRQENWQGDYPRSWGHKGKKSGEKKQENKDDDKAEDERDHTGRWKKVAVIGSLMLLFVLVIYKLVFINHDDFSSVTPEGGAPQTGGQKDRSLSPARETNLSNQGIQNEQQGSQAAEKGPEPSKENRISGGRSLPAIPDNTRSVITQRENERSLAEARFRNKVDRLLHEPKTAVVFYPKNILGQIGKKMEDIENNRLSNHEQTLDRFKSREAEDELLTQMITSVRTEQIDLMMGDIEELRRLTGAAPLTDPERRAKTDIIKNEVIDSILFGREAMAKGHGPLPAEVSERLHQYSRMFENKSVFEKWATDRYGSLKNFENMLKNKLAEERFSSRLASQGVDPKKQMETLRSDIEIKEKR